VEGSLFVREEIVLKGMAAKICFLAAATFPPDPVPPLPQDRAEYTASIVAAITRQISSDFLPVSVFGELFHSNG
jgi:hypothetical protein